MKLNAIYLTIFFYFCGRSADMSCEDMKKIERGSKNVGETGPECTPNVSSQKTCSIHPLKTNNCYKLWLELPSPLIRSKPVYVFPLNYGEQEVFSIIFLSYTQYY